MPAVGAVLAVLGVLAAAVSLPRYRRVRRPVVHGTVIAASGTSLTLSLPTGERVLPASPADVEAWRRRLTYEDDVRIISVAEGPSGLMLADDLDRQLHWPRLGLAGGCCFAVIGLLALDPRALVAAAGVASAAVAILLVSRPPRSWAMIGAAAFLAVTAGLAVVALV
ncbi:hypothetical protein [Kutzneria buriramensis]|uniref:Uncharacterized protein n=1 Tax=Kutzneria buriramensis TaxID=1045776 RepID=A0A3E0H2R5_9PSEU|nr:hypothetical protein [Kutzneria buriramensis]REH36262.1 hypothetical protein BCF44_116131 [Kutzneria buriramensis]